MFVSVFIFLRDCTHRGLHTSILYHSPPVSFLDFSLLFLSSLRYLTNVGSVSVIPCCAALTNEFETIQISAGGCVGYATIPSCVSQQVGVFALGPPEWGKFLTAFLRTSLNWTYNSRLVCISEFQRDSAASFVKQWVHASSL